MNDVSILGLGASGMAATRLVLTKGGTVYVSDTRSDPEAAARAADLRALGASVGLGGHDVDRIARSDTVVVSPGIPPDSPVLRTLRARGVEWISEPELAVRFFSGPLIAVTGTNGKTTTCALVAHLLETGGQTVGLGGNIGAGLGPPASTLALQDPPPTWYVLEMSSFQLADIRTFHADVGVLTNLAPDHLDRYDSLEAYYGDKARLFLNADVESRWVLNADQPEVQALAGDTPGRRFGFSVQGREVDGAFLRDDQVVLRVGSEVVLGRTRELPFFGTHNLANALAAAVTARLAGIEPDVIAAGLRTAAPLAHRLEPVAEVDGVLWLNDSKATNVAAAVSAVESLEDRPLVLLLGGKDKGEDLEPLVRALPERVRRVVAYGAAGPRLAEAVEGVVPVTLETGDFEAAVEAAARAAHPGDCILLAPACSSYDMFEGYEERGLRFRELARDRGGAP